MWPRCVRCGYGDCCEDWIRVMATIMPGLIPPVSIKQYAFKRKHLSLSLSIMYNKAVCIQAQGSLVSDAYLRGTVSAYPSHRFTVVQSPNSDPNTPENHRDRCTRTSKSLRSPDTRERERRREGVREGGMEGRGESRIRVPLRLLEHFVERRVRTDVENIASLFAMIQALLADGLNGST